jgi:hypothetical protein
VSTPNDEFEPAPALLDALLSGVVAPQLRRFERELRRPITVDGHTAVRGVVMSSWRVPPTRRSGVPLTVHGRSTFRRTGGTHILFRVHIRAPRSPETTWTGFEIGGRIRQDQVPVSIEPESLTILHNQTEWLVW